MLRQPHGRARTVTEIYQGFADKFAKAAHALEAAALAADASASPDAPRAATPASGGFGALRGHVGTVGAILTQPMRPVFDALAAMALKLIGSHSGPKVSPAAHHHRDPNAI